MLFIYYVALRIISGVIFFFMDSNIAGFVKGFISRVTRFALAYERKREREKIIIKYYFE